MNDMEQLKALDPMRGHEPSPDQWARARADVERIMRAAPVNPWPRRAVLGAAAAAVAVGIVAVSTVVPGATEKAFASWTPRPGTVEGEQRLALARTCATSWGGTSVTPEDVLVAESRGTSSLVIMKKSDGAVAECMTVVPDEVFGWQQLTEGPVATPPGTTTTLETMSSRGSGDSAYSSIVGQVGPDVTGVDVRLDDGRVIGASVASGWWTAWWPGEQGGQPERTSVVVHTAAGSTTHNPMDLP